MDSYFNGYKTKYEMLNLFMGKIRASRYIKSLNIFISLDDLFHRMHKPYTDKEFQCTGEDGSKRLLSNIMNVIGHYKNWAMNEGMNVNMFVVYTTSKVFRNQLRESKYREHFNIITDRSNLAFFNINSVIEDALIFLPVIAKYIPRVYSIDSGNIEPSIVPLLLSIEYPTDLNIVVSRDEYDLQYAYMENFAVLSPKGDNSSFITKGTLWTSIRAKENISEDFDFHPELYTWVKSIIGDKYRGIPKLARTGWKTIIKYIRQTAKYGTSSELLPLQIDELSKYLDKKKISVEESSRNYYLSSVKQQVAALMDIDKYAILSKIQDMEDYDALRGLNNTMFKLFPLSLQFLYRGLNTNPNLHHKYKHGWR